MGCGNCKDLLGPQQPDTLPNGKITTNQGGGRNPQNNNITTTTSGSRNNPTGLINGGNRPRVIRDQPKNLYSPSVVLARLKQFTPIDKLDQFYTKLRKDDDHSENINEDHSVYQRIANQQYVCIKTITKNQASTLSKRDLEQISEQIRIMQEGNAGICDIYEALKSSTGYHVVEEYFEGGNLDAKRINIGGYFDEMRCAEIIEQVLQVLCFLHEKKIVHRNICPASIMFKSIKDNNFQVKVSGFDYSSTLTNTTIPQNASNLEYCAPEIIRKLLGDEKVDIWALGILTYYMIEELTPFYGEPEGDQIDEKTKNQAKLELIKQKILNKEVEFTSDPWNYVSEDCKNFVRKCLNKDPKLRPTALELNSEPFILNYTTKGAFEITQDAASKLFQNVRNNKNANKFQFAVLSKMALFFGSHEHISSLQTLFMSFDVSNTSKINRQQLNEGLQKIAKADGEAEDIKEITDFVFRLDKNKDGSLDQREFIVAFMDRKLLCTNANLTTIFKEINKQNKSGLSKEDIKRALPVLASDNDMALEDMMSQMNCNAERRLQLAEFLRIMQFK